MTAVAAPRRAPARQTGAEAPVAGFVELAAVTEPGKRVVALAESLAEEIAPRAAAHDRNGSFPLHSFAAVKRAGYFTAPIPEELGGLGVASVHDVLVASSRLARGDASLTLGVNMHLVFVLNVLRRRQIAVAAGDERRAGAFGETLAQIAREGTVFAAAVSELGQDLSRPATTAVRTESGWTVSGEKVFCTMAAAADVFYTAVTYVDGGGRELYGYALVPRSTPGVVVHDDWDALGMRASASHSVSFEDVRLPPSALRGGFPVGDTVEYLERNLTAGLFHGAVALGIAEGAHADVARRLRRREGADPRAELLAAQNVVDLAAARAVLGRAGALVDGSEADLTSLFAEAQSAKAFVSEAAMRVVERAFALAGGAGYLSGSRIARAYRDVRATPLMHPLGANRAYAFLGELAAGRAPALR